MNELRNGINTRLESRKNYDSMRSQFMVNRSKQDQQIIKPINQDDFVNFHNFSEKYNEKGNVNKEYEEYTKNRNLDNKSLNMNDNKSLNINHNISTNLNKSNQQINIDNRVNNSKKLFIDNERKYSKQLENQKNRQKLEKIKIENDIENEKLRQEKIKYENLIFNEKNKLEKIKLEIKKKQDEVKNSQRYTNQSYVPEIGKKKKLINILMKVFKRRNLSVNEHGIEKYIDRYNLACNNIDPKKLSQIIFDIKNEFNKKPVDNHIGSNIEFEEETKLVSFLVSINSRDRDIKKWSCPNEYSIEFAPQDTTKTGYINRSFDNVESVQLVSAIFPKYCNDGNNLEDYPYLILEVDELGSNYEGTNDNTSKAFGQLTFEIDLGKFKKLVSHNENEYKKYFNPRVSLNKFTIRIKTPDGNLYNFGSANNTENNERIIVSDEPLTNNEVREISGKNKFVYDPNDIDFSQDNSNQESTQDNSSEDPFDSVSLIFKISCYQRKLENMYLNRRDS